MVLVPLNFEDVLHVASNMRDDDREEIFATRWNDDPVELAQECQSPIVNGCAWTAGVERPIAALGAVPMWPGVWTVWMFATPEFHRIGISLTKFIRNEMIPGLCKQGHRAECRSIATHTKAHRWLETLGAKKEATLEGFGRNGQDFFVYSWHRDQL